MAQKFIPEIVDGDKRILMINGEPVPYCLARVPLVGLSASAIDKRTCQMSHLAV